MRFQEQIAACHEFDGVRKEKERLTAAYWSRELQLHLTDLFFTGISLSFFIGTFNPDRECLYL